MLLEGRRPRAGAADEIVLPVAQAKVLHARVGDAIPYIRFGTRDAERCLYAEQPAADCSALFAAPNLKLRIVGIVRSGTDLVNRTQDLSLGIASPALYEKYRNDAAWSYELLVKLKPGVPPSEFEAAAQRVLPPNVHPVFNTPNKGSFVDAVDVLSVGLLFFGLVAGLAGGRRWGRRYGGRHCARWPTTRYSTPSARPGACVSRVCSRCSSRSPRPEPSSRRRSRAGVDTHADGLARRAEPSGHLSFDFVVIGVGVAVMIALVVGVAGLTAIRPHRVR